MTRYGYLQARVQSRYAMLPGENLWRELAGAGDLGGYLAAARDSALSPWLRGITPHSSSDEIEERLRKRFSEVVVECGEWCAREWRAAVSVLPRLQDAYQNADPQLESFQQQWRDSLPRSAVRSPRLALLTTMIGTHLKRFSRARPSSAMSVRAELEVDLRKLFRRSACRPEALFIWLALVALLLERLRGELVVRALFSAADQPFPGGV